MSRRIYWPTQLNYEGRTLIPQGDPVLVRGELWMSYVPDDEEDESGLIIERSASGRLLRTN